MNLGFWEQLNNEKRREGKPIVVLAPMADVTDAAFRRIIAKYSEMGISLEDGSRNGPDALWTEFVSADGLCLAHEAGKRKLLKNLLYDKSEHPIIAQLFGSNPDRMEKAVAEVTALGFDGIDINMGCPDKNIERQGGGAAMMKNPKLAQEIVGSAMRGAEAGAEKAGIPVPPVSVKTRIGFNKNELTTWLPAILETGPAVITVHARTRKEMSKVPARWEHVREAVEIRDAFYSGQNKKTGASETPVQKTLIFGNGDVRDLADAYTKAKETGADGVMFGRAVFGNPWLFNSRRSINDVSLRERLAVMIEHTKLYEQLFSGPDGRNFALMKKHYKAYINGFDGANELRTELMEKAEDSASVERIVNDFISSNEIA